MMQSCCTAQGTGKYFSKSVRRFERRFRNSGLDKAQQKVVNGLIAAGIDGKSVLEIGCGVGGLHLRLLQNGASTAQGIELSEAMVAEAKKFAERLELTDRTGYTVGDFAAEPVMAKSAEIVVMDKVICCYASPAALIHHAAEKCRTLLAVTYPRKAFLPRVLFQFSEMIGKIFRWSFHPLYHSPEMIERTILQEGFEEIRADTTPVWQIRIYRRNRATEPGEGSSLAFGK